MVRLIPEKTVEIWTAFCLRDVLGADTWIWSRSSNVDQDAWAGKFRKWFMLELKASEAARDPYVSIDCGQLDRYVSSYYDDEDHPDVVYVLPDPPWNTVPAIGRIAPPAASPAHRKAFGHWAYVIPATDLLHLIGYRTKGTARVRCCGGVIQYGGSYYPASVLPRRPWLPWPYLPLSDTLTEFLHRVLNCYEPIGTALRGEELDLRSEAAPQPTPTLEREFEPERVRRDLRLSAEAINHAIRTSGGGRRGGLLYVGMP